MNLISRRNFCCYLLCQLILLSMFAVPAVFSAPASETTDVPPLSPLKVTLSISNPPPLNQIAEVTGVVTSSMDIAEIEFCISLPEGFRLESGSLSWMVSASPIAPAQRSATVRSLAVGDWRIEASAKSYLSPDSWFGSNDSLTVRVSETTASIVPKDTYAPEGSPGAEGTTIAPSEIPPLGPESPMPYELAPDGKPFFESSGANNPGTITIKGTLLGWVSKGGSTATWLNNIPLVLIRMTVHKTDGTLIAVLAWTSYTGTFSISFPNPGSGGFQVRAWTEITNLGIVYRGDGALRYTYWNFAARPDGTYNLGGLIVAGPPTWGQWRDSYAILESAIEDYYGRGVWYNLRYENQYAFNMRGTGPGGAQIFRYPYETFPHAHLGGEIHIPADGSADGSGWAKSIDVIRHEYGHEVMYKAFGNYYPPDSTGSHWITTHTGKPNLAWAEGWADALPILVDTPYSGNKLTGYYDKYTTDLSSGNYFHINLETPTWGTPGWENDQGVEGRVAGALIDIFDATNDGYDTYRSSGTTPWTEIWDTFVQVSDNFDAFWTKWLARGHNNRPIFGALGCLYVNTIDKGYMSSWSGWYLPTYDGKTPSNPALISSGSRMDLVVRGTDNKVYHAYSTNAGATWSTWKWVSAGYTIDQPALEYYGGFLHLVVRGTSNQVYHTKMLLATGVWGPWVRVSGGSMRSPAALEANWARLELVIRGTSNALYHASWTTGGGWSGWDSLGTAVLTNSKPSVAVDGFGFELVGKWRAVHVVVRGTDNKVMYNRLPAMSSTWAGWVQVQGGLTISEPAFINSKAGRFDLVVVGPSSRVYQSHLVGGVFSSWKSAGTKTVYTVSTNAADGNVHLMCRSASNSIWYTTFDTTSNVWGAGWHQLPGAMGGSAAIATRPTGILAVVRSATTNALYLSRR